MIELILVTALLAGSVFWLSHTLNGRLFLGAPLFWSAWLLLVVGGWSTEAMGIFPPLPASVYSHIYPSHAAAFIGSILGIFLASRGRIAKCGKPSQREALQQERLLSRCAIVSNTLFWPMVLMTALVGTVHFLERWASVDFNYMRIADLRRRVLAEDWSLSSRVASYFSVATNALTILSGTLDGSRQRVHRGRLLALWLCNAPQGLAFGGRAWTLATLLVYLSAFLLFPRSTRERNNAPRGIASFAAMMAAGTVTFTILGLIRTTGVRPESRLVEVVDRSDSSSRMALVSWFSASLWALGTHAEYARNHAPTLGQATFEYFWLKLSRWNVAPDVPRADWLYWMREVLARDPTYGFTWCVPPTFIPALIFDFGEYGSLVATALFLAAAHWCTARWSGKGLVRHTVAFLAAYAMLGSIQTLFLLNSLSVWMLVIAFAWEVLASLGRRPRAGRSRSTASVPHPALAGKSSASPGRPPAGNAA